MFPEDVRERYEYRSLSVTLLYLGPQWLQKACFVAYKIHQIIRHLTVDHFLNYNQMVRDIKKLRPAMTF